MEKFEFDSSEQRTIFENLCCMFKAYHPDEKRYLFQMLEMYAKMKMEKIPEKTTT